MKTIVLICLVLSVLVVTTSAAQQLQETMSDSTRGAKNGLFPLPIVYYTPETGIAGGIAALYIYYERSAERGIRPSSATGDIIYTQKKQILVEFGGDFYFNENRNRLVTNLTYQRFPNKLFGIGNNTPASLEENYTPESFVVRIAGYTTLYSRFNLGPLVRFESVAMRETDPSGFLATHMPQGSKGGTAFGFGFVANWDSRDNTFAARSGSFHQLTALLYRKEFVSYYNFMDLQVDSRHFFELIPSQVLAVQAFAQMIDGDVPFQSLAKFGGQSVMRGYFDGRYRDRNGVTLQAEYRIPVWWRLGLVGFAGIAQVSDKASALALDKFWFAGGMGLRFLLNADERINLRIDFGFGNNSSGVYVTVTEAF